MLEWQPSDPFRTDLLNKDVVCIELRCPYPECRMPFIVYEKGWRKETNQLTRPCPYCFRAAYVDTEAARAFAERFERERQERR
jgi:hypothetical protein